MASAICPPSAAALDKARLCPVPPTHLFIRVQPSLPSINKVRGVLAVPEEQQACDATGQAGHKRRVQWTTVGCMLPLLELLAAPGRKLPMAPAVHCSTARI